MNDPKTAATPTYPASFWAPRPCLLAPVPEIFDAARLLGEATDAHLQGDTAQAAQLFKQADIRAIGRWTEALTGKPTPEIHRRRTLGNMPPLVTKDKLPATRLPTIDDRQALLERDGHHCRYCGIPVIRQKVRDRIRTAYPDAIRWGRLPREQHTALQAMWLTFDHIVPLSRGGDNTIDNMVICCQPCNSGKLELTLDEVGLADPRTRPLPQSDWDGLERFA